MQCTLNTLFILMSHACKNTADNYFTLLSHVNLLCSCTVFLTMMVALKFNFNRLAIVLGVLGIRDDNTD